MARLLYRLGRFSARRAWTVIISWLAVLLVTAGGFLLFGGTMATTLSVPGTPTERVTDELTAELGGGGATGSVVFHTSDGSALSPEQRERITAELAGLTELDGVTGVVDPFATAAQRAEQEQTAAAGAQQIAEGREALDVQQQQLDMAAEQAGGLVGELAASQEQLDAARAELDAQAEQAELGTRMLELTAEVGTVSADESTAMGMVLFEGDTFSLSETVKSEVIDRLSGADLAGAEVDFASEIASSVDGLVGPAEIIGVVVAAIVLLIMLRALLPAMMPLISSLVGVGIGVTASLAFSDVVEMTSVTPVLGVMLGLAVGIDYALFIINRHRRQLLDGMDVHESIGLANGTAGNAVVFAGSTVLIALLALNVTGIGFLGVMGTVGAACVLIAVLIAVSFTPALLGLLKIRVLSRRDRERIGAATGAKAVNRAMGTPRAVLSLLAAVVGLLVVAVPALSMRLGLPDGASEAPDTTQYQAYTIVAEEFGPGQNGPLVVTASLPSGVGEQEELATQVDLADRLMAYDEVVAVAPAGVSEERDFFAFQVIPVDGPSSETTERLVHELRGLSPLDGDIEIGVAGAASGNIDISDTLAEALPIYLVVVIGLSLLIMIVVFRSLLVPILATGGFVLSLFAALGAVVAVYQWGWLGGVLGVHEPGPVLNFAPLIIVGVLFGLAMDYQLFLVSGMREAYVHGTPAREAVTAGLRNGRAVVTAAAIIMISVFGGFVFSHMAAVKPLGFGLAVGVLFDAFVVRMVVVPAVMHLVGDKAWWLPRWLDRILPDVDVEGAKLERAQVTTKETVSAGDRG